MSYPRNYYRPSTFGGFSFFPPVIKWLLIVNGAAFVLLRFFGSFTLGGVSLGSVFNTYLGLMPLGYGFLPWQLLTYQFVHADFYHILFNMFFGLWMFGMEVEHQWGSKKFLLYYLLCGIAAGVAQLTLTPIFEPGSMVDPWGRGIPTVGASGAVYGVLVAFAVLFPDRYIFLYFLIPVKAKYLVAGIILLGVFSVGGNSNVAHVAHLGGALAGYLFIVWDRHRMAARNVADRLSSLWGSTGSGPREEPIRRPASAPIHDIQDARFKEEGKGGTEVTQQQIDDILDKIGSGGYQSLTEEEKRILFEASKKLN
jgi:membrane associated rhomboid family serine protease